VWLLQQGIAFYYFKYKGGIVNLTELELMALVCWITPIILVMISVIVIKVMEIRSLKRIYDDKLN